MMMHTIVASMTIVQLWNGDHGKNMACLIGKSNDKVFGRTGCEKRSQALHVCIFLLTEQWRLNLRTRCCKEKSQGIF